MLVDLSMAANSFRPGFTQGAYTEPGKSRQMYDDYFASKKTRIRIGTSLTRSRDDRFSDTDQSSPDNTSIYNSDVLYVRGSADACSQSSLQWGLYSVIAGMSGGCR